MLYTQELQQYNQAYYMAHHNELLTKAKERYHRKRKEAQMTRPVGRPRKNFENKQ